MEIPELKKHLTIGRVLPRYGLKVNSGHIHCPFHQDKTLSMRVYEKTNTVYCFSGKCPIHEHNLDVIEFV